MFGKFKLLLGKAPIRSSYDAVIIGGGLHGLATAYYLAKNHGMKNVAVIEKNYIGFGGAGRNTAIVRANQRTKENLPLYEEGLKLWPKLTAELDFNLIFNNCGNLNLAHSVVGINALRLQIASAQFRGIKSELLDPKQCKELIPKLDISDRIRYPIFGTMFRIKNYTAPINAMRLNMKTPCIKTSYCEECNSADRICNTWTITEKSFPKGRVKVVLINEDLGM